LKTVLGTIILLMGKKFSKDIIVLGLFLAIILFFMFPLSFEMSYMGEMPHNRGYGFPYIFLADDPTTSIYKIIDLKFFIIDLLVYAAFMILMLFAITSTLKKQISIRKRTFFILVAIATFSVLIISIPTLYFSSFSEIEYIPIYNSIKVNFLFW
jgi:hypothetical protein